MSANPFDHAFLSKLLGDAELASFFTVESDIAAMLKFELGLARASCALGIVPHEAATAIEQALVGFQPDLLQLNNAVLSDGVVIPNLITQLRAQLPEDLRPYLHYGATSQDVIDTSLMLRLTSVLQCLSARLTHLKQLLDDLCQRFGGNRLMGHTRMQAALPIRVADRLQSWAQPLQDYQSEVDSRLARKLPLQFGGAVGTLEKFGMSGEALRAQLALELDLADQQQWHSQRGIITDIAHLLAKISGALGKIGQDVALLAQGGSEITLSGGGASSAMPHKQNPVSAEVLVAQARYTATLIGGLYQSQLHEQERSGAAWTLEWMLLPQIVLSCGASTMAADRLLQSIICYGQ